MPEPKPLLGYDLIHTFPASRGVLPLEGFAVAGASYCGEQPSAFESTENSWDNGDPVWNAQRDSSRCFGRWRGPGAIWIHAENLWLEGAMREFLIHDDVARVAVASTPAALWSEVNPGFIDASGQWRVILQDAATGAFQLNVLQAATSIQLPTLNAHAILWVRLENGVRSWSLPPDYLVVRGLASVPAKFKYSENGEDFVWDWEADVGRRPTDSAQKSQIGAAMWDEYNALLLHGGLIHRGQWSQYISDGGASDDGGPWSALRIAVGSTPFEVGVNFQPAPGAVLNRLNSTTTKTPILVDPLALSVSAFGAMQNGEARLGGTIATTRGTFSAYWHFTPDASTPQKATLLGMSQTDFLPVCEASLYPNVSDILQREDETELVLTHSHLHRYDADAASVTSALPGLPVATLGHPGGRCLREIAHILRFLTEYFGGVGAPIGSDVFAQFYDTLQTLSSRGVQSGRGTVFHGDNCAETFFGDYCGWVQDKAFGDATAKQFLARLVDGNWQAEDFAGFAASVYRWQRLRAVSTPAGQKLIACGKEAATENAIWATVDAIQLREAALKFRARRLTRVALDDGTEKLYAVGRFVSDDDNGDAQVSLAWSVIALSGEFVKVCAFWNAGLSAFTFSRAQAIARGLNPSLLPAFLKWNARPNQPAGGYWTRSTTAPTGAAYLALSDDGTTIKYSPVPNAEALPYSPLVWNHFCFTVYDDGGVDNDFWPPLPACGNAQCVGIQKYIIVSKETSGNVWDAIQVSDVSDIDGTTHLRKLHAASASTPNLWLRIDSDTAKGDLSSYTIFARWNEYFALPKSARRSVDACVLIPDDAGIVRAPVIDRRD